MTAYVCLLFEGTDNLGPGVLDNSLYRNGFRGTVFAASRGALPPGGDFRSTESGTVSFLITRFRSAPVSRRPYFANKGAGT